MRNWYLLAAAAGIALAGGTPASAKAGDKIEGSYICVFKPDVANARAAANRAAGASVRRVYEHSIRGFSAAMGASAVAQLQSRNPNIAFCEQDQVVEAIQGGPFDFRVLGRKPAPSQPPQTTPWGIARVNGGSGTPNGVAWIIDTGIDFTHPDLNVDQSRSVNFSSGPSAADGNGHGTHVSGIIAAKANTIGVIGVTPGARVIAVRVLNNAGSGSNSDVIAGVDWVAGHGANGDVANMSLGGGPSQALDNAVVAAAATGVKFTIAAGNESDDANNHSPARANGPNVYTVSAFSEGDNWASFSNFGNPPIDFGEPGVGILSTYKGGGYATLSGTSMAAPHLAGILLDGGVSSDGIVNNDPDNTDDAIGVK